MPILPTRCVCGEEFEALVSFSTAGGDRCPKCNRLHTEGERIYSGRTGIRRQETFEEMLARDPDGVAMALETKEEIESRAEEYLEGSMKVEERGPPELRPQVPERLKRRFF